MTTFHIEQFGCRATQADAAAIEHRLLSRGYTLSPTRTEAQVVVVNTGTVTSSADNQARQAIHEIHRSNPNAQIVVTGCYAQRAPEDLASLEGVAWVIGNSHKSEIPRLLDLSGKSCTQDPAPHSAFVRPEFVPLDRLDSEAHFISQGPAKILTGNILESDSWAAAPVLGGESGHTRPVLKIQDGCNNRCSYCVIPFVRGRSRSLPPDAVIAEIRALVDAGAKEVVLSGINLGSYGRDLSPRAELIGTARRILGETRLEQLRFSSIEPQDVTEEF